MHRIDGPGATVDNHFTEGDPTNAVPATVVTDDWLNTVQEELMSILAARGIAPVKASNNQVLTAIQQMIAAAIPSAAPDASESTKGILKLATTALARALVDDATALTPKKLADAFTGANQSFAANGFQKLPGGLIIQWGVITNPTTNTSVQVTFPVIFPNAVLNASESIVYDNAAGTGTVSGGQVSQLATNGMRVWYDPSTNPTLTINQFWFALGY